LSDACKEKIISLLDEGFITKPQQILQALKTAGIDKPKLSVLNSFLGSYRKKKSPPIVSLGELQAYCINKMDVPQNEDEAFVVHSQFNYDSKTFGIFVSTKRLIAIAQNSRLIQADATYKLNWQGFPVIIIGSSDMDRKFHQAGISVTTNESTADFKFVFGALQKMCSAEYTPKVLLGDAADAITNGFVETFGPNMTRVFCWAHVIRKVDQKLCLIADVQIRRQLREDIVNLQLARSRDEFEFGKGLFLTKYKHTATAFLEYFNSEWLGAQDGWFEGQAMGAPSTNNGLESINKRIKEDGTLRQRLPMGPFMDFMFSECKKWSERLDPTRVNCKLYSFFPSSTLSMQVRIIRLTLLIYY
jgi:hypothetical protein